MDNYKVVFSDWSKAELKIAKAWYDLQLKGLGHNLILEIKEVSKSIERNPLFASVKYSNTRVAFCKKFPYGIHYLIIEETKTVFITSIFHQNQQPFWDRK